MAKVWLEFLRRHTLLVIAILVHLVSVGGLVYAQQTVPTSSLPVSLPKDTEFPQPTISGIPTGISIPSVNINLQVEPGVYDKANDSWTLSGYNAHFATITRPANNGGGNTFIYGHNNKYVFGPIKKIAMGAEAKVTTDIGNTFYYKLVGTRTTEPSDVSLFTYKGSPILTVQTCTGAWHEQRQLYTFKLERVEESSRSVTIRSEAQRQRLIQSVAMVSNPKFELASDSPSPQSASQPAPTKPSPSEATRSDHKINVTLQSFLTPDKPFFQKIQPQMQIP